MKSKSILYNADMVRAWFSGRKTQSRVPLRTQPRLLTDTGGVLVFEWETRDEINRVIYTPEIASKILLPYCPYSVGMEIYGRETWMPFDVTGFSDCNPGVYIGYKASNDIRPDGIDAVSFGASIHYPCSETEWEKFKRQIDLMEVSGDKWHPSIHLNRKFSRIHQTITGIRVEQVCDISEEDAIAEGMTALPLDLEGDCWTDGKHKTAYEYLWKSLYGDKHPWESTWVWVIEYPRCEGAK